MTREDAIEVVIDGQDDLAFQAHLLAAWRFKLEQGHEPSIDELRVWLTSRPWREHNFWTMELARRSYGRTRSG